MGEGGSLLQNTCRLLIVKVGVMLYFRFISETLLFFWVTTTVLLRIKLVFYSFAS